MDLPDGIWIDDKTGKTAVCRVCHDVTAVKAYSRKQAKFGMLTLLSYHMPIVAICNCLCEGVR